jgi:hypothetical protein
VSEQNEASDDAVYEQEPFVTYTIQSQQISTEKKKKKKKKRKKKKKKNTMMCHGQYCESEYEDLQTRTGTIACSDKQ